MGRMIFRGALGLYSFMAITVLGFAHVFFPDVYFAAIEYPLWDPADPVQWEMVQLIGVSYMAQGLGGLFVLRDPGRNRDLFLVLMAAGIMSILVVAYTIMIDVAPQIVWFNTVIPYSILTTLMLLTYPWDRARRYAELASARL